MSPTERPLIGLTGRRLPATVVPDVAPGWATLQVDAFLEPYTAKVLAAGGLPLMLPRSLPPTEVLARLDGVLLVGGTDVEPGAYGGPIPPGVAIYDPDLDRFETALAQACVASSTPLLGICRGCQVLNVALGGTLLAHLPPDEGLAHSFRGHPPSHRRHRVRLDADSALGRLYGDEVWTNSYHHQAVDRPGDGVRVVGRTDDGVAEAIEVAGVPALAVQWHPELHDGVEPAFTWLVDAAQERSA